MMRPIVREATPEDRAAILKVVEAAFGGADEARVVERLWADDAVTLDLVGEIGDAIVGHCAFSPVTVEPAVDGGAYGMAPVSVAPAHQRKGVGAAMIETGLAACRARGASLVVVLGAPAYYARFGFVPASGKNLRWDAGDVGDAFQLVAFASIDAATPRTVGYHRAFYGQPDPAGR